MVSVAVGLLPLRIELFRSIEFYPGRVLLSLHNMHLCRHSLNFAHVPVVDAGHLPMAIVTASQLVSVIMPLSAASPRQQTRVPFLRFLDSLTVIVAPPVPSFPAVMRILREAANRVLPFRN